MLAAAGVCAALTCLPGSWARERRCLATAFLARHWPLVQGVFSAGPAAQLASYVLS